MKVLLVNGSPHRDGCTFTSLSEVAGALNKNGVESEIFWIGNRAVQGCIGCWKCLEEGARLLCGASGGSLRDSRPGVFLSVGIFSVQTRGLRGQLPPRWSERDIRPVEQILHHSANAGRLKSVLELDPRVYAG